MRMLWWLTALLIAFALGGCAHPAPTVVNAPPHMDASTDAGPSVCAAVCERVGDCPIFSHPDGGNCEQGCNSLLVNYPDGARIEACAAQLSPGDCAAAFACVTGDGP